MKTWGRITRAKRLSLAKIADTAASGDMPHALDLARSHVRKTSVKALALRKVTNFGESNLNATLKRAADLNLLQPELQPVRWRYEEKASGRYRLVCDPPLTVRVAQHIAKELLHAQWSAQPHIFEWPGHGGCQGAVAAVRDALNNHGRYVVSADIRDCYPTFNPDYLYTTNMLPPELVETQLDSRQFRYRVTGDIPSSVDHTEQTRPRGLLQGGAASSAFLAIALDDLPAHMPDGVVPIVSSDNIILICRSEIDCNAAATALGRYLNDNPAGAFSPSIELAWVRSHAEDANDPDAAFLPRSFEQLGYCFGTNSSGGCIAVPSAANELKAFQRAADYIAGQSRGNSQTLTFQDIVQEAFAGFPARSAEADEYFASVIEPEFVAMCRSRQVRVTGPAPLGYACVDGLLVRIRTRLPPTPPWCEA